MDGRDEGEDLPRYQHRELERRSDQDVQDRWRVGIILACEPERD